MIQAEFRGSCVVPLHLLTGASVDSVCSACVAGTYSASTGAMHERCGYMAFANMGRGRKAEREAVCEVGKNKDVD